MAKLIDCIEGDSSDYEIEYRIHATRRMFQRDINEDDVEFVVRNGEVVERYEQDFSLPSLLLLGESQGKKAPSYCCWNRLSQSKDFHHYGIRTGPEQMDK